MSKFTKCTRKVILLIQYCLKLLTNMFKCDIILASTIMVTLDNSMLEDKGKGNITKED